MSITESNNLANELLKQRALESLWHDSSDQDYIRDNYVWRRKSTLTEDEIAAIRAKCNIVGGYHFMTGKPICVFDLHVETNLWIGYPPFMYGAVEVENAITYSGEKRPMEFGGKFVSWRTDYDQKGAVDKIVEVLLKEGATQLCLDTGMGKTLVGLKVACELGVKTLVIVHKKDNVVAWKEKIEAFIPHCKVGEMRARITNVDDKDIVFTTVQSLSKVKKYPQSLLDQFGLAIADEVHLMAAEQFHLAFTQLRCKYKLGLTATPERDDGLHSVIEGFFNKPSVVIRQPRKDIIVQIDHYKAGDQTPMWLGRGANKKPNLVGLKSRLVDDPWRNQLAIKRILERVSTSTGQCLIVTERKRHVYDLERFLNKAEPRRPIMDEDGNIISIQPLTVAAITGDQADDERTDLKKCDLICATLKYATESLDLPNLTSLFIESPVSKKIMAQLRGRLLRIPEAETKARGQNLMLNMLYDDWEEHGILSGMFWGCYRYFKSQEYKILHSEFDADTMTKLFPETTLPSNDNQ